MEYCCSGGRGNCSCCRTGNADRRSSVANYYGSQTGNNNAAVDSNNTTTATTLLPLSSSSDSSTTTTAPAAAIAIDMMMQNTTSTTIDHDQQQQPPPPRRRRILRASICLKLTVFVGVLVVLASGIPALVLWLKAHEQLIDEIEHRLLIVSTLRQEQLKEYLDSEIEKAGLISSRVLINNYLRRKPGSNLTLAEYDLTSAVSIIADFIFSAMYDGHGRLILTAGFTDGIVHVPPRIDVSAFRQSPSSSSTSNRLAVGFPQQAISSRNGWIYNITKPIFEDTRLVGVFLTWANGTRLESLVYDRTGLQTTGELMVGRRVNDSEEAAEGDAFHLLFPSAIQQQQQQQQQQKNSRNPACRNNDNVILMTENEAMARAIAGESGVMRQRDACSGAEVVAAYRPVGFMHWGLVAKIDIDEAYAPVQSVRVVILTTISILVFVGVMASLGLAKVFTDPIIELGRAAASLGQGNMRTRVRKGTVLLRDEIADLMDTFNSMAHQIASHQLILEQKVRERTLDLARANNGLAQEIEERRRIEAELEEAKDVAISANRYKSEFLANMSHEIRTPLNAIINFTELCLDTQITPEQREHLDYVRFAAQHLLRLITDILDFSKIEAGKMEMEEVPFSLSDQLEHALSVLAARALHNGLELCCDIEPDVPDQMVGDPVRLLQIFVNLIGNGIKFTNRGEVVVSASVRNRSADSVELLFSVRDTGLGIPEDKQSLLFRAFSQVDSSTQRIYGGTGLGLVISSKLATAMGGRMWVESSGVEGEGSTFFFTAKFFAAAAAASATLTPSISSPPPAADLDATSIISPQNNCVVVNNNHRHYYYGNNCCCSCSTSWTSSRTPFYGAKALVVDDNATNCRVLARLLQSFGMIADCATSVEAARMALDSEFTSSRSSSSSSRYRSVVGSSHHHHHHHKYYYNVVLLDMHLQGTDTAEQLVQFLLTHPHFVVKFSSSSSTSSSSSSSSSSSTSSSSVVVVSATSSIAAPPPCITSTTSTSAAAVDDVLDCAINAAAVPGGEQQHKRAIQILQQQKQINGLMERRRREVESSSSSTADGESRWQSDAQRMALGCIIMLTSVNHTDANRCEELGVTYHMSKPIKRSVLLRTLHAVLGIDGEPCSRPVMMMRSSDDDEHAAAAGSSTAPPLRKKKKKSLHILVAEDNIVNQRVIAILLQKWGHSFVMARNGQEAFVEATNPNQRFHLILMDVQMPICDGFQATAKIREAEASQSKHTPIIAMTAHAMAGDEDRCIAAGMDFYISKPLNAKKLQELIDGSSGEESADST